MWININLYIDVGVKLIAGIIVLSLMVPVVLFFIRLINRTWLDPDWQEARNKSNRGETEDAHRGP
jgi:hypothetical protein